VCVCVWLPTRPMFDDCFCVCTHTLKDTCPCRHKHPVINGGLCNIWIYRTECRESVGPTQISDLTCYAFFALVSVNELQNPLHSAIQIQVDKWSQKRGPSDIELVCFHPLHACFGIGRSNPMSCLRCVYTTA